MSPEQKGIAGCILLVVLLCTSLPVAFSMAVVGVVGFAWVLGDWQPALNMMSMNLFDIFSNYNLTVIPLFVLMGQLAFHGGISRRLFSAAYNWLGGLPGGLAMATVGACAAFGAICGSGPATTATMASVALPEMKRYGYDMQLGTGVVAAGGTLGMMIPPSVVFIVYAILTEQSIGKLFISGIIPGIMTVFLFCLTIYWQCKRRPQLAPAAPKNTLAMKLRSLLGVSETLILFALVMGGMFAGWFSANEAAAIGAAGTVVITVVQRKLTWKTFAQSLRETMRTSCMVMVIVAGAAIFGNFLAITRLPFQLAGWLSGLAIPGWCVIGLIIVFYLFAGCFVDALALVLLTVPIFYPVVVELGYHPIWFGVMIVLVTQMGVITPPVGVCVYVVSGIERDVPLQTVFKGAMPYLYMMVIAAILITMFPQLCLWLPNLSR
ncbi:MAG: TRAP transporter large permease [Planctomycetaceae bacterium]|nr:TRAP transporter large permease [Planctomycetaceae bacterium]